MYNPRRPLTRRQTARIVVAVSILAWATQTLLAQWGFGQSTPAGPVIETDRLALSQNQAVERFIPRDGLASPVRLELRSDATVIGEEVRLRQVARWAERDNATMAPVADLVLVRLSGEQPFGSVALDDLKRTLRDAGVNLAAIHFVGATRCTVSRVDAAFDESRAMEQWVTARRGEAASPAPAPPPTGALRPVPLATDANLATTARVDAAPVAPDAAPADTASLRSILLDDLAHRTGLPRDSLHVTFRAGDEPILNLSRPQFDFQLDSVRARTLGQVAWNVTINPSGLGAARRRATVVAEARAWQAQVVTRRGIAHKQLIREEDLEDRRTLVDRLPDDPPITRAQAVGQQAARDLKPGMVLTAKLVDAVPLVRPGQFVTITLAHGGIEVKTVAKALEGGAYGQTIRVRNETTRELFQVVITGPQSAVVGPQLAAGAATP